MHRFIREFKNIQTAVCGYFFLFFCLVFSAVCACVSRFFQGASFPFPRRFFVFMAHTPLSAFGHLILPETTRNRLDAFVAKRNVPHLLFVGPPGTGKTATVQALVCALYGTVTTNVLQVDAGDDRGTSVFQNIVHPFAERAVRPGTGKSAPFKLVIVDDADSLTPDAQFMLRRTIEVFSSSTRFCFICNSIGRLIQPLTSRCALFRFPVIRAAEMTTFLKLRFPAASPGFVASIVTQSKGDMRQAMMMIEVLPEAEKKDDDTKRPKGQEDEKAAAAADDASGDVDGDADQVNAFLKMCRTRPDVSTLQKFWEGPFQRSSVNTDAFLTALVNTLVARFSADVDAHKMATALNKVSDCDAALRWGADPPLQLIRLGSELSAVV